MKIIVLNELQKLAQSKGGKLLSDNYIDSKTKLKWQCNQGHIWETSRSHIINGSWCPYCKGVGRGDIKEMKLLAQSKGGVCLSEVYVNQKSKLKWQCSKGHIWLATPTGIKTGTWCPHCAENIKRTIQDMHNLAKMRGGKCLSSKYINSSTKLKWQCDKGHIWKGLPDNIKQGSWCPKCAHLANADRTRGTLEEMQKIAKSKGGKCLSKEYINSDTYLEFQCKNGHIWKSRPTEIKRGKWCRLCGYKNSSILRRGNNEDIKKIISAKNGKLLTDEYYNNRIKINIQCSNNHIWATIPKEIRRGRWCPYCLKGSRSEQVCRKVFEKMFEKKFPCVKPKWLKNLRGNQMELDGFCQELNVAFEYQGKQHYEHHKIYSKDMPLKVRQEDDQYKEELCKMKGINLFVIPYKIKLTKLPEFVVEESKKKGINVPNPSLFDVRLLDENSEKLEKLQEIAKIKKGRCLAKSYIDQKTGLSFQCQKGHIFQMQPKIVLRGSWCPLCLGKRKFILKDMQEIARRKEGLCLSDKYVNSQTKLKWKCKKGHIFEAKPNNIIYNDSWCPKCAGRARLTLEEMQEIAKSKGGKCLSTIFNSRTKLKWQCAKGHIWEASIAVKHGTWCPYCAGNVKKTITDMQNLAKKRGGICLSKEYVNAFTKLEWECEKGHTWYASPSNIQREHWCPICAKSNRRKK